MIITIDGPSGTGKSTVAKELAARLGWTYFDTGALYRSIAWKVLQSRISSPASSKEVEALLERFDFAIETRGGQKCYFVDGEDVTTAIRTLEVTSIVSEVSAMKCVRDSMLPLQRKFSEKGSTVFEGRDLGTIVFPDAHLKFFLTASCKVRAARRLEELKRRFPGKNFEFMDIFQNIQKRDKFDSERKLAPLKCAEDAITLDTSDLLIEEVVSLLENYVKKKL